MQDLMIPSISGLIVRADVFTPCYSCYPSFYRIVRPLPNPVECRTQAEVLSTANRCLFDQHRHNLVSLCTNYFQTPIPIPPPSGHMEQIINIEKANTWSSFHMRGPPLIYPEVLNISANYPDSTGNIILWHSYHSWSLVQLLEHLETIVTI
jgi:hypothetical protein